MRETRETIFSEQENICALQKVYLQGNVFQDYALLNLKLEYQQERPVNLQTAFLIALPYHAMIRRFTVTTEENIIAKGYVAAREDLERELLRIEGQSGVSVILRSVMRGVYALTIDALPPCTSITIAVECYAALEHRVLSPSGGERTRLVFPAVVTGIYSSLMPHVEELDAVPYMFCVDLELAGATEIEQITSPTHMIKTGHERKYTRVMVESTEMTRDFVLDIRYKEIGKNTAYVVRDKNGVGGLAFYNLHVPICQLPEREGKRCRILLDASGNLMGARWERAKNTVREFLKRLPLGLPVQFAVFTDRIDCFSEQAVSLSEEIREEMCLWLSSVEVQNGCAVAEALSFFFDWEEGDTGVMISSGAALGRIHVIRLAEKYLKGRRLCFVVTDSRTEPSVLPRLGEIAGGLVRSFAEDAADRKAEEIWEQLFVPALENVSLIPSAGVFDEIIPPVFERLSLRERVKFVVRFRGNIPSGVELYANDGAYRTQIIIEEVFRYEDFDLLSLTYGFFRLRRLYDLLISSPASVWGEIRSEIIKTAVEYQLLCDDAYMMCELPLKRAAAPLLRADVPILKNRPLSEYADSIAELSTLRSGADKKRVVLTAAQHTHLLFTILYAQYADGSFADFNSFASAERAETTALCLAALCREGKAYDKIMIRAVEYLLSCTEEEQSVPAVCFALRHAYAYLSRQNICPESLQMFWKQKKASAAFNTRADAELPSCVVRGEVSSAARLLLTAER